MSGKAAQEKYEIFLRKHNEGVETYVPKFRVRSSKHKWYTTRCAEEDNRGQKIDLGGNWRNRGMKLIERDTKKQGMIC